MHINGYIMVLCYGLSFNFYVLFRLSLPSLHKCLELPVFLSSSCSVLSYCTHFPAFLQLPEVPYFDARLCGRSLLMHLSARGGVMESYRGWCHPVVWKEVGDAERCWLPFSSKAPTFQCEMHCNHMTKMTTIHSRIQGSGEETKWYLHTFSWCLGEALQIEKKRWSGPLRHLWGKALHDLRLLAHTLAFVPCTVCQDNVSQSFSVSTTLTCKMP